MHQSYGEQGVKGALSNYWVQGDKGQGRSQLQARGGRQDCGAWTGLDCAPACDCGSGSTSSPQHTQARHTSHASKPPAAAAAASATSSRQSPQHPSRSAPCRPRHGCSPPSARLRTNRRRGSGRQCCRRRGSLDQKSSHQSASPAAMRFDDRKGTRPAPNHRSPL